MTKLRGRNLILGCGALIGTLLALRLWMMDAHVDSVMEAQSRPTTSGLKADELRTYPADPRYAVPTVERMPATETSTGRFSSRIQLQPEWVSQFEEQRFTAQLTDVVSGLTIPISFDGTSWTGELSANEYALHDITRGEISYVFNGDVVVTREAPFKQIILTGVRDFAVEVIDADSGQMLAEAALSLPIGNSEGAHLESNSHAESSAALVTGMQGKYHLDGPLGTTTINVVAAGYASTSVERPPFAQRLRVAMRRASALTIEVKDGPDANLKGRHLWLALSSQSQYADSSDAVLHKPCSIDEQTKFEGLNPGEYTVSLYDSTASKAERPLSMANIVLAPSKLCLLVMKEDTKPEQTSLRVLVAGQSLDAAKVGKYAVEMFEWRDSGWTGVNCPSSQWRRSQQGESWERSFQGLNIGRYRVVLYPFGLEQQIELAATEGNLTVFEVSDACRITVRKANPVGTTEPIVVSWGYLDNGGKIAGTVLLLGMAPTNFECVQRGIWLRGNGKDTSSPRKECHPDPDHPLDIQLDLSPGNSPTLEMRLSPPDLVVADNFWSTVTVEPIQSECRMLSRTIDPADARTNYEGRVASSAMTIYTTPGMVEIRYVNLKGQRLTVMASVATDQSSVTLAML